MLPSSSAVSQIQQYVRAQEGVVEVARASPDQLLLTVGERVQATVTGQLPSGRFAVQVKDQLLDLNLPSNTQPGEQFELVVAGKDPRLTFTLSPPLTQSANQPANAGVALSTTARLLGELAAKPEGQTRTATLRQSQPLFDGVPQPEKLANALASRLAESGLFYESHQAEWVNGERPLQTLLREPQAKLTEGASPLSIRQDKPDAVTTQALPNDAGVPVNARQALTEALVLPDSSTSDRIGVERQTMQLLPSQSELLQNSHNPLAPSNEQNVRQLVQQQLSLLESNPLVWQGQAWPGQPLHWKTELQNEGSHVTSEEAAGRVWQTRLDLNLPRLGELGVSATLRDGQFNLRFEANTPATVKLLRDYQATLLGRFDAAGLKLAASQVFQHADDTAN